MATRKAANWLHLGRRTIFGTMIVVVEIPLKAFFLDEMQKEEKMVWLTTCELKKLISFISLTSFSSIDRAF